MNNKNKSALLPKLRFPGFKSAGPWTTEMLGSVATISTQKVGNNVCVPMSITSGVGLVSQEEKFGRVIAGDSYKNYLLLKPNEFAYNKSATKEYPEGFLALYSGTELAAVPNSIFTCFRINVESPDVRFLNYQFSDNLHGRWLRKFIQVGARAHGSLSINDSDLMALPVPTPTGATAVAEQQKIADCLSSLDELVAAQARKVDALKTHKKGLMQQLFPSEGKTQPRLRFPEFRGATLRSVQLGRVTEEVRRRNGEQYSAASVMGVSKAEGIIPMAARIIAEDIKRYKIVEPDWFAYNPMRLNIGSIARWTGTGEILVSPDYVVFRCITAGDAGILPSYFVQFRQTKAWEDFVTEGGDGGVRVRIYYKDIAALQLLLPSLVEQQRISDCLSSLDELITTATEELEALKSHKKGLMQQLFPAAETVES